MDQRAYGQFIGALLNTLKKLNKNNQCLCPECQDSPIGSHVIAKSVLKRIAENGKVLTWKSYKDEIVKTNPNDQNWQRIYETPQLVGIENEVKYPIFCKKHDNKVFRALEHPGFDSQSEQVVLLAYRALCYKTWNPHLQELLEHLVKEPEKLVEQQRLFATNALLNARQRLENMLNTQDYTELKYRIIQLHIPPCIACTDAFIPIGEAEDTCIANGSLSFTAEDVLTFSLFPNRDSDESTCVITWFYGSQRVSKYIESLELDQLSEDDLHQILVCTGFTHNIYISPTWWESLSQETKQKSVRLQLAHANALTNL